MAVKNFVFLPSTNVVPVLIQEDPPEYQTVFYTDWFELDMFFELIVFLELTAQGGVEWVYEDETLDLTIQSKSPNGQAHDIVKFNQIGDKTGVGDLPFYDKKAMTNFGSQIRFKIEIDGEDPTYTFSLTGYAKL